MSKQKKITSPPKRALIKKTASKHPRRSPARKKKLRRGGNAYLQADKKRKKIPMAGNVEEAKTMAYDAFGLHVAELSFKSADFARKQRIGRTQSSIDHQLETELQPMRDLSRNLFENNEIYQSVIERAIECGVGPVGYKPIIDFENDELNEELTRRWNKFAESPEIRGIFDWKETLEKVYAGYLVDGDIGAVIPKKRQTQLQLIEAIQIGKGRANDLGVVLDRFRRPIAYNVFSISERSGQPIGKGIRFPKEEFLLVANYLYPSQSRGVPKGQAIFPDVHRLVDVLNSEAIAWQINARIALIVNKVAGAPPMPSLSDKKPDSEAAEVSLYTQILDSGQVYWGETGDLVSAFDNSRPNLNFERTVKLYAGIVGLPFGIPLPILMFDWQGLNYSTMRGLIEQAGKAFKKIQKLMIRQFCTPVWVWKVNQWVKGFDGDRLRVTPEVQKQISKVRWDLPSFPWVDELRESEAHGDMLDRSFTTQRAIATAMDADYVEIRKQREIEIEEAWKAAVEVSKATGGKILPEEIWRTFAGLELGKTAQAVAAQNGNQANQGASNGDT